MRSNHPRIHGIQFFVGIKYIPLKEDVITSISIMIYPYPSGVGLASAPDLISPRHLKGIQYS